MRLCWPAAFLLCPLAVHAQTRLILDPDNTISTLAGSGRDARTVAGVAPDVALGSPRGLVYDSAGNLYIADARNHQIDRVTPSGTLTIFAGDGRQGYSGDGGPAISAELNTPTALALAPDGSLYVSDTANHCIRRILLGTITTVAGVGAPGFGGDGGAATAAHLRSPGGLAFAADGSLYIADTGNHRIRKVSTSGSVSTVVGTGAEDDLGDGGPGLSAAVRSPGSLLMLPDGRLLIADRDAHRIRSLLADGTVVAYTTGATQRRPEGLGTDASGNLLIADAANQEILMSGMDISGAAASSNLAGSGVQGTITNGSAAASAMDSPAAATADSNGNIVVSDRRNHQVQRITLASLAFGDVPAGRASTAQTLTIANGGLSDLHIAAVQLPSGFTSTSGGSAQCASAPFSLQPAASCGISIAFSPVAQAQRTGFLHVQITGAPPSTVVLTGNGTAPGSLVQSVTTLTSDGSISYAGMPVQLATTVSGTLGMLPGGNITFFDGSVPLSTVTLAGGSAKLSTAVMQTGEHKVRAAYSGDAAYAASTSSDLTQTVLPAPDFTISAGSNSYNSSAGAGLSIPMSILPINGSLNHTVTLNISGLPAGTTALFTPSIFTLGGDPTNVSLAITFPTKLSRNASGGSLTLACGIGAILFLVPLWRRRRVSAQRLFAVMILGIATAVCSGGCGGIRATPVNTSTGTTAKTFSYTAVVTATSTGVMGDVLTHTATFGLVVTQ